MNIKEILRKIFFPKMGTAYFIRVVLVAVAAFVFFRFVCRPMVLDGKSMEPNFHTNTLNFCWMPAFHFRNPRRGDVVVLKYAGDDLMLLKRIVGLPGDTVEFRDGVLYLNGKPVEEPYVKLRREKWNLKPRKVDLGCVYVVGDNRSMPIAQHVFGEIDADRIMGTLLL